MRRVITAVLAGLALSPFGWGAAAQAASAACPSGAVAVAPGVDLRALVGSAPPATAFCLASGTYSLTGPVVPKPGDRFIGASAAHRPVIDASATTYGFQSRG